VCESQVSVRVTWLGGSAGGKRLGTPRLAATLALKFFRGPGGQQRAHDPAELPPPFLPSSTPLPNDEPVEAAMEGESSSEESPLEQVRKVS
jgi:hypothetical protein